MSRTDKVDLLAYDEWRIGQRREIRKQLSDKDWGLGVESVLIALSEL